MVQHVFSFLFFRVKANQLCTGWSSATRDSPNVENLTKGVRTPIPMSFLVFTFITNQTLDWTTKLSLMVLLHLIYIKQEMGIYEEIV